MTLIQTTLVISGALATGLPQLEAAFPPEATPYLKGASAIFALLTTVLGGLAMPIPSLRRFFRLAPAALPVAPAPLAK